MRRGFTTNKVPTECRESYASLIEVTAKLGIRIIDVIIQRTNCCPIIHEKLIVVHHIDETKPSKTEKMILYLRGYTRSIIRRLKQHYYTSVSS